MTTFLKRLSHYFILIIVCLSLVRCGGGGGDMASNDLSSPTGEPAGPSAPAGLTMNWNPPEQFADATPLNPVIDLDTYEIYISEDGVFTETDAPAAYAFAVDANNQVVTSFDLSSLDTMLDSGKTYYVSMRSVTTSGVKSEFSEAASFSL